MKTGALKWNGKATRASKYALPDEAEEPEQGNLV